MIKSSTVISDLKSFYDVAGNLCTPLSNGRLRVTTLNTEPSMTNQSDKDSCDINLIVAKFVKTGELSNVITSISKSGDFSMCTDYLSAVQQVQAADEAFMDLPANVRARFANNAGNLISFLEDPSNKDEAIKLGLVNPSEVLEVSVSGDATPVLVPSDSL